MLLIAGTLSFAIGSIWISSRFFGAVVLQRSLGTVDHSYYLQIYGEHYQVLIWALRVLVAGLSIIYVVIILINKQGLPKWLAIFNPIVLLIIVLSSLFWFNPLGIHIAPIAMNITHFIFFSLILFQVNRTSTS